jgi:hypothetical protein
MKLRVVLRADDGNVGQVLILDTVEQGVCGCFVRVNFELLWEKKSFLDMLTMQFVELGLG